MIADGICKAGSQEPVFKAYSNLTLEMILNASIVGFFSHPMNSLTACLAYCAARNETNSIIVDGKICACSSGNLLLKF